MYNYSPQTIAQMTPLQQIEMLSIDPTDTYHFNTYEEYTAWKAMNNV